MKNICNTFILFLILLISWELFSRLNQNFIFILPSPLQVLLRLWEKSDRFWFHTLITFQEMLSGFLLALLIAFPLALLMDLYKSASSVLQPLFIIIQCIPMFTLAPIMIVWFGWSSAAIIVPTALMIFFPLTINIYQGLRSTPQSFLDFFTVNRATSWQIFYKLKLPGALPHIFGGFRLAAAIAGVAAVAGEWAGAQNGLGILMLESRRDTDLATNFAALFCLTTISISLYSAAVIGEYAVEGRLSAFTFLRNRSKGKPLSVMGCCIFLPIILASVFFSTASFEKSNEQTTLTLDWLPNANHIPLYTGIKKGFFLNEGIDLKIQKLRDSGNAVSYLTSGQSDLALNYMPNTVRIRHKGAKVTPVGILIKDPLNAIIFRKDSGIKNPLDLTGKRLGYCSSGKESALLKTVLDKKNIYPSKISNMGLDIVPFFGNRHVDAIYGAYWNIETEHLRSLGIDTDYFPLKEFNVPHYHEIIVLARTDSVQAQPEFIQRFQRAMQQSIDYSKIHFEEAFRVYVEQQKDQSVKTRQWSWNAWQRTLESLADRQEISKETWKTFENWLLENQLL